MDIDRQELLNQIVTELGLTEREPDEFTAKELADGFNTPYANLVIFMESNEIQYTRRKAMADGRRVYVYKIIMEMKG